MRILSKLDLLRRRGNLGDDSGNAIIELAFIFSFLIMPLLLGTVEVGYLVYDSIEISNAASAAAMYGMTSSTLASDNADMTTIAQAEATDFGTNLSVTPTTYYVCSNNVGGTQYSGANAQTNANAACTGAASPALQFVSVKTSASVTPPIHCPGLPTSVTLNGLSVMEVFP
jgi:Flp pilus assembly protein TadG